MTAIAIAALWTVVSADLRASDAHQERLSDIDLEERMHG
jgi:hypothetical protein